MPVSEQETDRNRMQRTSNKIAWENSNDNKNRWIAIFRLKA